jgi:hypothetical protein
MPEQPGSTLVRVRKSDLLSYTSISGRRSSIAKPTKRTILATIKEV